MEKYGRTTSTLLFSQWDSAITTYLGVSIPYTILQNHPWLSEYMFEIDDLMPSAFDPKTNSTYSSFLNSTTSDYWTRSELIADGFNIEPYDGE
tara:strand:- start:15503 stop:15781 length:279 start_codon:yes stop_codon:yes gene_type:complete